MRGRNMRKLLEILSERAMKNFFIWCGAGVSISTPCGLPSGYGLSQQIFREYMLYNDQIWKIWRKCNEVIGDYIVTHPCVRPEVAVSCITRLKGLKTTKDFYQHLSKIQDVAYNANHMLLAAFVYAGGTIFTANLDMCIEKAYQDIYGESLNQEIMCNGKVVCYAALNEGKIYHFHGVFQYGEQAGASIESVLNGFDRKAINLFNNVLVNSIHLFIGYSFSDDYDINNVLHTKIRNARIFVCNHEGLDSGLKEKVFEVCGDCAYTFSEDTTKLLKCVLNKMRITYRCNPSGEFKDWKRILRFPENRSEEYKLLYTMELLDELRISWRVVSTELPVRLQNLEQDIRSEIGDYLEVLFYYVFLLGRETKVKANLTKEELKTGAEKRLWSKKFDSESYSNDFELNQKLEEVSDVLSEGKILMNTLHETISICMRMCLAKKVHGEEIKNLDLLKRVANQICQLDYSQGEEVYIIASGLRYRYLLEEKNEDFLNAMRIYYDVGNLEGVISCLITAAVLECLKSKIHIRDSKEWISGQKIIELTGNELYKENCKYITANK